MNIMKEKNAEIERFSLKKKERKKGKSKEASQVYFLIHV